MKRNHIVSLVVIVVLMVVFLATFQDASTYNTFLQAEKQKKETCTVIGTLVLTDSIVFQRETLLLRFTAKDKEGEVRTVYYNKPKPIDFERSEEITMTGYANDTAFIAQEILMKCPSKYADEKNTPATP